MRALWFSALLMLPVFAFADAHEVTLPALTGPFAVGTTLIEWNDRSREEPWTADTHDNRRVLVQLWYPARPGSSGPTAPYIPREAAMKASLDAYWPDRPHVATHARLDAAPASTRTPFPIIIFSHGMNSSRFRYTAILEELASHGFVVAAIEHPYWSIGTPFQEGAAPEYKDGMAARDQLTSAEIDAMMAGGVAVMEADQAFVASKLRELATTLRFRNRLDVSRIGVVGHSMGGMAATRACLDYTAVAACASLDGPVYSLPLMPMKTTKPFLLLLNSGSGREAPLKIKASYIAAFKYPNAVIVPDSKHNTFSDAPLFADSSKERDAHEVITRSVVAFFKGTLGGDTTAQMPQGIELVVLVPVIR